MGSISARARWRLRGASDTSPRWLTSSSCAARSTSRPESELHGKGTKRPLVEVRRAASLYLPPYQLPFPRARRRGRRLRNQACRHRMRLVANQNVHPVLVGHRGCDLVRHIRRGLQSDLVELLVANLDLQVGTRRVLLNSPERSIAQPDI